MPTLARQRKVSALLAALLVAIAGRPAVAHAFPDHADPKVGSEISVSPSEVKIWFTDDFNPTGTSIEVLDSAGKQVDKKDFHQNATDKTLGIVSVPALPPGKYKVVWKALCLEGHTTQGDFTFTITAGK